MHIKNGFVEGLPDNQREAIAGDLEYRAEDIQLRMSELGEATASYQRAVNLLLYGNPHGLPIDFTKNR